MSDGIYTALSGAMVQSQNLEILSNNLANTSTPGFKSVRPVFQSVLTRLEQAQGPGQAAEARVGVEIAELGADFTPGPLVETGNDLDVAIEGNGLFAVQTPQGARYTRRGTLQVNNDRQLTIAGNPVRARGGGDMAVPEGSYITVAPDGEVYADDEPLGFLEVVQFADPANLVPIGGGLYQGNGAQADEESQVLQGYLESSNVNPVWGMTELIQTTRTFEASQKVIETYKDIDRKLTTEIGRI